MNTDKRIDEILEAHKNYITQNDTYELSLAYPPEVARAAIKNLLATQKAELLNQMEEKLPNTIYISETATNRENYLARGFNQALQDTHQAFNKLREEL